MPILIFDAPSIQDVQLVREWRNADISFLRTPFMLTEQMQKDFYHNVISNRNSDCRFWSVKDADQGVMIGFAGLVNIEWENRLAEISLVVSPKGRGGNCHILSVRGLLDIAFRQLNLQNVHAECYTCNTDLPFWKTACSQFRGVFVMLPNRKYWNGKYWDSMYLNFEKSMFYSPEEVL